MDAKNNPNYFGSGVAIKNAIKKYGKENFTKQTLESGFFSYSEMAKAEIKWIKEERIKNSNGIYNMNDGGLGCSSNKGKKGPEIYGKERSKKIGQSISNALRLKGIKPPSRLGSKGSEKQREAVRLLSTNRKRSQKEIDLLIARTVRPIQCVENGITYPSLKNAAESLGLNKGNICSILKGTRKHTKGLTFRYLE